MSTTITLADRTIYYRVDSLTCEEEIVHGQGWVFTTGMPLKKVAVELSSSDDKILIDAQYGRKRDDIVDLYPDIAQARYSGFSFHAPMRLGAIQSAYLIIGVTDEEKIRVPLHVRTARGKYHIADGKFVSLRLMQKAWRLVRRGQWKRLWQAVAQYAARVPRREKELVPALQKLLERTNTRAALLVVDHELGGGANQYRERVLAPLLERGESVFVLTFYMPILQYVLEYRDAARTKRFALSGPFDVLAIAESGLIRQALYNNSVSFQQPIEIPELLVLLKEYADVAYQIALHDYFCVCPSHFLLNDEGRYCGLPSASECNRCLASNTEAFVPLSGVKDIARWRESWARCLLAADEVACFSATSRSILRNVYPQLPEEKLVLRPHVIDYLPPSIPKISLDASLHIGIVGHLTRAKGAEVVHRLAEQIANRELSIPITLIGTLDAAYRIPSVRETGAYTPGTLPREIEQSGANLFLFPSIWPETFSYVIGELMAFGVPIVCFNIGAPAERIAAYPLGRIVSLDSNCPLLDELLSFHASLKNRHRAAAVGERN